MKNPVNKNLVTVVDSDNRPLCYLDLASALNQNLHYRTVALLLKGETGKYLCRWKSPLGIDFSVYDALPSFQEARAFFQKRLQPLFGSRELALHKKKVYLPCPQNGNTFTTVFSGVAPKFEESPGTPWFMADRIELLGLEKSGCLLEPLLKLILDIP